MQLTAAAPAARARRTTALALALAVLALAVLWLSGTYAALGVWALEQQRALQGLLAQQIQDIRAGRSGAFWGLMALSAGYGFVHAVGPGHGKILVTGAALGTAASARRMAAIALAGSLAQALFAIALVYGAFLIFQASARAAIGLEATLEPLGHLVIALVGAWLVSRGLWAAWQPRRPAGAGTITAPIPAPPARVRCARPAPWSPPWPPGPAPAR
jgi:nickel/cobalt transporter (NicO) family protein